MSEVAIIGAGIGGLSTAVALEEFGFDVQVYEATEPVERVSAGTWVPPNAMRVLERLELAASVRERGAPVARVQALRENGREVGTIDFESIRERTGFGNYSLRRAELRSILLEALDEDTVAFERTCRRVAQSSDGVSVYFEDGSETRADVLVGADGIESYVRGDTFGIVRLRFGGSVWCRGIAEAEPPEAGAAREYWGGEFRFGWSGVDGGRTYWYAPVEKDRLEGAPPSLEELRESYRSFPHSAHRLLDATDPDDVERVEPRDVRPLETWSSGRVVLVGDAAHAALPNLSQGAAQAIEDGWALGACLDRWNGVEEAFERFEEARLARANRVIRHSRFLGRIAHLESPVAAGARDWLLDVVPGAAQRWGADWLYEIDDLIGLAE